MVPRISYAMISLCLQTQFQCSYPKSPPTSCKGFRASFLRPATYASSTFRRSCSSVNKVMLGPSLEVHRTCSQSAISVLTFPILFTRSLNFETAPDGCNRSFTVISNGACVLRFGDPQTYQHSRILLPRQGVHLGYTFEHSAMVVMFAHNNGRYTRCAMILSLQNCGRYDIDDDLQFACIQAALTDDDGSPVQQSNPCKN